MQHDYARVLDLQLNAKTKKVEERNSHKIFYPQSMEYSNSMNVSLNESLLNRKKLGGIVSRTGGVGGGAAGMTTQMSSGRPYQTFVNNSIRSIQGGSGSGQSAETRTRAQSSAHTSR